MIFAFVIIHWNLNQFHKVEYKFLNCNVMKSYITILFMGCCMLSSFALPVTQTKEHKKEETSPIEAPDLEASLGYERYMREVAAVLESDPKFRAKLENATEEEIRSGKIAEDLPKVNISMRLKLDEIKRRELQRLKELKEIENEINGDDSQHLDHKNQHTFEIKDLKDLIKKIYHDLDKDEQKRKEQFKEYEMQKKFEDEMKKKEMANDQREKLEQEQKAMREKHKKHPKMHHPGNKAQLEEVWEKQDHMDVSDFEPRKFFMVHDLDSNGYLDDYEVKALFVKELDKGYQAGLPEDDMMERAEEMERMREEFFQEFDANRDHFVSIQEFMERANRKEFNEDPEWQTLDEKPQFTHEEYIEFERRRLDELQRRIARGEIPPHNMPQGYVHGPNVVYETGQQHPYSNQQQQMHYQDPQQQHVQQQQQYQQQQQQYQQQQYQQQQQPQYQQHQYTQQQPHVNLNPNQVYQQIPVQQHQQHQPQVMNQLPPQEQHQPRVNNLPPQQPVGSNNLPPQQPVANNNLQPQQPVASNNLPPQQQQQAVTSSSGVKQQSVSNNMHS